MCFYVFVWACVCVCYGAMCLQTCVKLRLFLKIQLKKNKLIFIGRGTQHWLQIQIMYKIHFDLVRPLMNGAFFSTHLRTSLMHLFMQPQLRRHEGGESAKWLAHRTKRSMSFLSAYFLNSFVAGFGFGFCSFDVDEVRIS